MAGTIINFLVDLTYAIMFISIIVLVVYAGYLMYLRRQRNDAMMLAQGQQNWITRVLIKMRDLGKKVRER